MRNLFILCSLSFILFTNAHAQILLHLQPNAADGKDATITSGDPSGNYGAHPEFGTIAWTCSGDPCNQRALLEFDLSVIPVGSSIVSAYLGLYANPSPVNAGGVAMQGANESVIRRITGNWDEMTVTWDNQPATTTNHEALIPQTSDPGYYAYVDVKDIVQDMVSNPSGSHGFLIQHTLEVYYKSMIFSSTDYANPNEHPEIIIEYEPVNCWTIRLDDIIGKDAVITSGDPSSNYGIHPEYGGIAWTCSGDPCNQRGVMQFDLSMFPMGTPVAGAQLILHANPAPVNGNGVAMQGANECVIRRITGSWTESGVTWDTQPATTTTNEVIIPPSADLAYNPILDVGAMVQEMINDPLNSHGFCIQLTNEIQYASMIFASSDYADSAFHPVLQVCFATSGVDETPFEKNFSVFPNPFNNHFQVSYQLKNQSPVMFELLDVMGRLIFSESLQNVQPGNHQQSISYPNLTTGLYLVRVISNEGAAEKKLTRITD